MILHAIKQAVKKVCPDCILQPYRDFRYGRYLKKLDQSNRIWVNNSFMRGVLRQ